jgi:hypothetical protein
MNSRSEPVLQRISDACPFSQRAGSEAKICKPIMLEIPILAYEGVSCFQETSLTSEGQAVLRAFTQLRIVGDGKKH